MNLVKPALHARGTGLRDSSLNFPAFSGSSVSTNSAVFLTSDVKSIIEEPISLLVSADDSGALGEQHLLKKRAAVLYAGEVRPYTTDEVRATAGTEFASGKAVHVFLGQCRHSASANGLQERCIKEGPGSMYFADGGFFVGNWVNNYRCGMGAFYSSFGYTYEGEFKDDLPQGHGVEHFPSGEVYVGEFHEGRPHGRGVTYYPRNGSIYVGEYSRGEKHGRGVIFYENGDVFEGSWVGGRRSGEGISTFLETRARPNQSKCCTFRRCVRAQWHGDKCKWETVSSDPTHEAPSLSRYIDEGVVKPLEKLESPFGCGVGTLYMAHEFVREIPPVLLRRAERCFDHLDVMFTGEVPFSTLVAALESSPSREAILQSFLKAIPSSYAPSHDAYPTVHLDFATFLRGFFPHISEADIQRHVISELPLETLLRLRGVLAGMVSSKKDGFLYLAHGFKEDVLFNIASRESDGMRQFAVGGSEQTRKENGASAGATQLTMEVLNAAKGVLGGVRVPHGLFLWQKIVNGIDRIGFRELLEGLYPCVTLQTLRRCEVTFFSPHVFQGYLQAFSKLDEFHSGSLSIQAMDAAQRQFLAARAKGHERIPRPANPLEKFVLPGRRRSLVQWEIGDIALSVSFAKYMDRSKGGSVTLADILRHAYPNVPCAATRARLSLAALPPRRVPHVTEGQMNGAATAGRQISSGTSISLLQSCRCCICTMCAAHGHPLGTC
ncbi:hypothetical protein MOQ_000472 [Trypanosoma cruzi marinkellei]|uniref:Phosphatidylinositol-4-phosphate 5-kinase n=1 Tax=Trypanosoma cruzi marinkellei TaxID=85056 RepID=K2NW81_TRYCR|nr:hypothetical protein MOQ_000472 [Trypanosoma cruzi marinkellei]